MTAGPGWPMRLCHRIASAFCTGRLVRELTDLVKKEALSITPCSTTHWPCASINSVIVESSRLFNAVGSPLVSHQMPCCLSSLNDTKLHRMSGHKATFTNSSLVGPLGPASWSSTDPYPCIQTRVFPAQMQSAAVGGRRFRSRSRLFVICTVEPESRMNECRNG